MSMALCPLAVSVSLQHTIDGVMPLASCPLAVSMPPPDDR